VGIELSKESLSLFEQRSEKVSTSSGGRLPLRTRSAETYLQVVSNLRELIGDSIRSVSGSLKLSVGVLDDAEDMVARFTSRSSLYKTMMKKEREGQNAVEEWMLKKDRRTSVIAIFGNEEGKEKVSEADGMTFSTEE